MRHHWTADEDARLIGGRERGETYAEIAASLRGRNEPACRVRAQKLNLAKRRTSTPARPRKPLATQWTDAELDMARRMHAEGLSGAEAAAALPGRTPGAVSSQWERMGLRRKRQAPSAPRANSRPKGNNPQGRNGRSLEGHAPNVIKGVQGAQKSSKAASLEPSLVARLSKSKTANPESRGVPIMELERGECRWPVNDPRPGDMHLFCGARARTGKSYCKAHARFAVSRATVTA